MTQTSFTEKDRARIRQHGLSVEDAEQQLALFRGPKPFLVLARACTRGDGIRVIWEEEREELASFYEQARIAGRLTKFVPASGAASRMFKNLLSKDGDAIQLLLENAEDFAFWPDLRESLERAGKNAVALVNEGQGEILVDHLLGREGLGYASLAKGLLAFHREGDEVRTPFEEHLVEGALYARDASGNVRLHFTISPEHRSRFDELFKKKRAEYEKRFEARFEIAFSEQKPSTDTLAVDLDDQPLRQADGSLVFRPGGHGALIENLADLHADVVLVKNIDNVVPDHRKGLVSEWKAILAGLLVRVQRECFEHLARLDAHSASDDDVDAAISFAEEWLALNPPPGGYPTASHERRSFMRSRLDRPLRVCGMVPNVGATGGGPFWVAEEDGSTSLQIVEEAQIDRSAKDQRAIHDRSTHFNPVDLACGLLDRHGRPFDLHRYVDPHAVFISEKSHQGRPLKALERPGLWNGAMARWNTIFVEVPPETFAPVKTVFDLLQPGHQPRR